MQLTPPKRVTFWIAVVLGVLGFLGTLTAIPFVTTYAFWFAFFGFLLLVLGMLIKDL